MQRIVEPNLYTIFRLFILLRVVFVAFFVVRSGIWRDEFLLLLTLLSTGINLLLLAYLYIRPLERRLGAVYLPLALIMMTALMITENRAFQYAVSQSNFTEMINPPFFADASPRAQSMIFSLTGTSSLFVPLILISWQYSFRSVLAYTFATTALDLGLLFFIQNVTLSDVPLEVLIVSTRNSSFLIVGYIVTQLVAQQRLQQAALQTMNRQLALFATTTEKLTISQERNRLARELHDTIAHTMSAVTVKLNAVDILWERDADRARHMLSEVIIAMNDGMAETRRALRDLRATPLDDMGFLLSVRQLGEMASQRGGFTLTIDLPEHDLQLSPDIEQGIYRITQEALTNIVEHANARHVDLSLTVFARMLTMRLHDDGTGFNTELADQNGHFGLQGMHERAAMLGGTLKVIAAIGQGTTILLQMEIRS